MRILKPASMRKFNEILSRRIPIAHILDRFNPADPDSHASHIVLGASIVMVQPPGNTEFHLCYWPVPEWGERLMAIDDIHVDGEGNVAFNASAGSAPPRQTRLIPLTLRSAQAAGVEEAMGLDADAEEAFLASYFWDDVAPEAPPEALMPPDEPPDPDASGYTVLEED